MAEAAYGGNYGGSYRLRLDVTQESQNYAGNYSTVRIVGYMIRVSSTGGTIWNDSSTPWSVTVDGQTWTGGFAWNLANGQSHTFLNTTKNIGHNNDGTKSFSYSAWHDAQNSPYVTSASLSGSQGLSTIPRYATITGFSASNITDTGFDLTITANANCDYFSYWLNGGAHNDTPGTGTSKTFQVRNLKSGTSYTVNGAVRRDDSDLWTDSSAITVTTLIQNKFFDFGDI